MTTDMKTNFFAPLLAVVLGAAALLTSPAFTQAQGPTPQSAPGIVTYDALIAEALAEFQASRWVESYNLFKSAHELSDNARTLRGMGMCSYELGEYARALRELRAALTSEKKPLTEEQGMDVLDLIQRAGRLVGTLEVTVTPASAQLFVNQKQTDSGEVVVKVGNVTVRAELAGYEPVERIITVDGGERYPITLTITSRSAPIAALSGSDELGPTPWYRQWYVWAGVGGVVVAGLIVGIAAGSGGDEKIGAPAEPNTGVSIQTLGRF